MNVRLAGCAAVLAAAGLAAPQAAHATVFAGFTCGYFATGDPTGTVAQPDVVSGTVFDYFYSGNTGAAPGPDTVTVTCSIQVNNGAPGGPAAVSASASGTGGAVLLPTVVSFVAGPGDNVFACTSVEATGQDGTTVQLLADDERCKLATTVGPAQAQPWDRKAGAGPVQL
jgi:hypothetical protein